MQNEILDTNMDYTILWNTDDNIDEIEYEDTDYILIDNPINRIKSVKY